jgi:hypothetical protein
MADGGNPFMGGPVDFPESPDHAGRSSRRGFRMKRVLLWLLVIVLVAGAVMLAWKLIPAKDEARPAAQTDAPVPTEPQASSATSDVPPATEMKTFKGDTPRLQFSYPATWTVTEGEDDVRIESPDFRYRLTTGMTSEGNFRIYIRQGARTVDSKYIARGVAALPSEKLTYTEPASGQRADTNLSFFGLDTPDAFAYFFIAGNFSLKKGDTLGPSYGKEPQTYIIAGGYSIKSLSEGMATNQVPLDYFQTTNAYKQAMDILKSLKLL